ncbi:MAG: glycosyltransferase family 39 protein [Anaerolineales bacterium]
MQSRRLVLWALVGLVLCGAALRLYALDAVPLRGDEAFSARFWAAPPAQTWDDLAGWEPHPFGTFVLFHAWRTIAGESEFALRALPALGNLIGSATLAALGHRLFGTWRAGLIVAVLWTVNPFQVWHAQDLRNYALWSAASPLAMWLFLRALEHNRPRDWLLYGFTSLIALNLFFLEVFFVIVQGLYVVIFARARWRPALLTWAGMAPFLLPWIVQGVRLLGSDYAGTAIPVSLTVFMQTFVPTLLFGAREVSLISGAALLLILFTGLARGGDARVRGLLALWLAVPVALLMFAGTQSSVFRPRYIIPITPALLLALWWIAERAARRTSLVPTAILVTLGFTSGLGLYEYFVTDPAKSPDWRLAAEYLNERTAPGDIVVLTSSDPAFRFYYDGPAADITIDEVQNAQTLLRQYNGIFIQGGDETFALAQTLQEAAQFIPPAVPIMRQFRAYETSPGEISLPLDVQVGDVARLRGYTIHAADAFGATIFLYWEPLRQTEGERVGFVHLLAPEGPQVIAQDDHAPLNGAAPTFAWVPGGLLRDVYFMRPPPGTYRAIMGMYDAETTQRLTLSQNGTPLGDALSLDTILIPAR